LGQVAEELKMMTARRNLLIAAMSLPVLLGTGHAVAQEATTTLDPINIQEGVESAFGTVDGYVAT
jgi:iron complex outermembrane receptor protein